MTFLFNKWNINTGLFQLNLKDVLSLQPHSQLPNGSPQVVHVSQFRIILQDLDHSDPWPPLALIITSLLYMFDTLVLKEKKLHHGIHLSTCAKEKPVISNTDPFICFKYSILYLLSSIIRQWKRMLRIRRVWRQHNGPKKKDKQRSTKHYT